MLLGILNDICSSIRENHLAWRQVICVASYQPCDLDNPLDSSSSELSNVHTSRL